MNFVILGKLIQCFRNISNRRLINSTIIVVNIIKRFHVLDPV